MLSCRLFFHPDLQDLMLRHGWRTGAIVPELETEIRIINTEQYMHSLTWQQALTGLLERMQVTSSSLSGAGNGCLVRVLGLAWESGDILSCVCSENCLLLLPVQWACGSLRCSGNWE